VRSKLKLGLFLALTAAANAASPVRTTTPPVESHLLKLRSFAVPSVAAPLGLLIVARVNGGPPLRLLLDTGAQFLVLDKKTAARSKLTGGEPLDLVSAGGSTPRAAVKTVADVLDAGDIQLRKVEVAIVEAHMIDGVDGVFPLTLFSDYLIRLDVPAKRLELSPLPASSGAFGTKALLSGGLLFLKGILNEVHEGYFLLDTGATYNAISSTLARRMNSTAALSPMLRLQSGTSQVEAPHGSEVLTFRVGEQELRPDPFVAVDLSMASRYYNFEVSGLVGYPALRNSVVTINYREQLVQIDGK